MVGCTACAFCPPLPSDVILTPHWAIRKDAYPVVAGHMLLTPRRHVTAFMHLAEEEGAELPYAILLAKQRARQLYCVANDDQRAPRSFTIGINEGVAAGQTIPHLHIHLYPRVEGDCENPRGGVRNLLKNPLTKY